MIKKEGKTQNDLEKANKKMRNLQVDGGRPSVDIEYDPLLIKSTFKKIVQMQGIFSAGQASKQLDELQTEPSNGNKVERKYSKMKEKNGLSQSSRQRKQFEEVFEMGVRNARIVEEKI